MRPSGTIGIVSGETALLVSKIYAEGSLPEYSGGYSSDVWEMRLQHSTLILNMPALSATGAYFDGNQMAGFRAIYDKTTGARYITTYLATNESYSDLKTGRLILDDGGAQNPQDGMLRVTSGTLFLYWSGSWRAIQFAQ